MTPRRTLALLILVGGVAGCGGESEREPVTLEQVCGSRTPVDVLTERLLGRRSPSATFEIGESDTYIAVTNYSGQGRLFDLPSPLYVVPASQRSRVEQQDELPQPLDPRVGVVANNDYQLLDQPAGDYLIYATWSPAIHVIRCQ